MKYSKNFWLLNAIQMIEKFAFWSVLIQLPVYIAQKDVSGGLHWEQTDKGLIFFVWAIIQNLTPVFSGSFADKYGYKKAFFISFIFIASGYVIMATQTQFYSFLAGAVVLGLGSGIFKPALQGSIALSLQGKKQSQGWDLYFMLINFAVFFSPPFSKFLKEISWQMLFYCSAGLFLINFILLSFVSYNFNSNFKNNSNKLNNIFKNLFKTLSEPKIIWLILIMSGFGMVYMQFYETLPNFIIDWADTSALASYLNLPDFFLTSTNRGVMISYEWLYSLNTILVIIFIIPVNRLITGKGFNKALLYGLIISSAGLFITGSSTNGFFTIAGIIIYTFGEMIVNPNYTGKLSSLAPANNKALYLGLLNISLAIGFGIGALLGGYMYKHFGEKSGLAFKFLADNYQINIINYSEAVNKIIEVTNNSPSTVNDLLWNVYQPYIFWLPFLILAFISILGMLLYTKKYS